MTARRTTRAKLMREAEALGVDVSVTRETGGADAWAPRGYVFRANGAHCVAAHFRDGPWIREVYGSLLEDIEAGFMPCPDYPDCYVCEHDLTPPPEGADLPGVNRC